MISQVHLHNYFTVKFNTAWVRVDLRAAAHVVVKEWELTILIFQCLGKARAQQYQTISFYHNVQYWNTNGVLATLGSTLSTLLTRKIPEMNRSR